MVSKHVNFKIFRLLSAINNLMVRDNMVSTSGNTVHNSCEVRMLVNVLTKLHAIEVQFIMSITVGLPPGGLAGGILEYKNTGTEDRLCGMVTEMK